jgi:hypothetical protein
MPTTDKLSSDAKSILATMELDDRDVALLKAVRELQDGLLTIDVHRGSITGITGGIVKRNFDNEEDLIQCLKETAIKIYR